MLKCLFKESLKATTQQPSRREDFELGEGILSHQPNSLVTRIAELCGRRRREFAQLRIQRLSQPSIVVEAASGLPDRFVPQSRLQSVDPRYLPVSHTTRGPAEIEAAHMSGSRRLSSIISKREKERRKVRSSYCPGDSLIGGTETFPRLEDVGAFPARRLHLGFHQLDLALAYLKGSFGDLRPVELREVLDYFERGDDEHVYEALRGLEMVKLHCFGIFVQ